MESLTWLHISDWHQKVSLSRSDKHIRRRVVIGLLRDIKRMLMRRHIEHIDFIVFSGDIAHAGKPDQYAEALATLIEPIERFTGVVKERWVIIPGNHDVDRDRLSALPTPLRAHLSPLTFDTRGADAWTTDPTDRTHLRQPFANFRAFTAPFQSDADWAYRLRPLPPVSGVTLEVYAFNSALYCGRKDASGEVQDYGGLFVGSEQCGILPSTPSPRLDLPFESLRLAVLHHPFSWLYQAEQARFQEILFNKVHFILVGHEHHQRVEEVASCLGDVVIIPAGPSFDYHALTVPPAERYGMAYNIVRVDISPGPRFDSGWCWMRRWDSSVQRFIADPRYPTVPGGIYPLRCLGTPPASFWRIPVE
jgi:predicted phosphodiesterase